jgi:hypothetical protein
VYDTGHGVVVRLRFEGRTFHAVADRVGRVKKCLTPVAACVTEIEKSRNHERHDDKHDEADDDSGHCEADAPFARSVPQLSHRNDAQNDSDDGT